MRDVIAVLKEQRAELLDNVARIDAAIAALGGVKSGRASASGAAERAPRKRRKMSADAKKAVSERMKNYWAERRKQTVTGGDAEAAE